MTKNIEDFDILDIPEDLRFIAEEIVQRIHQVYPTLLDGNKMFSETVDDHLWKEGGCFSQISGYKEFMKEIEAITKEIRQYEDGSAQEEYTLLLSRHQQMLEKFYQKFDKQNTLYHDWDKLRTKLRQRVAILRVCVFVEVLKTEEIDHKSEVIWN